jgi:hypothetical protein
MSCGWSVQKTPSASMAPPGNGSNTQICPSLRGVHLGRRRRVHRVHPSTCTFTALCLLAFPLNPPQAGGKEAVRGDRFGQTRRFGKTVTDTRSKGRPQNPQPPRKYRVNERKTK